MSKEALAKVVQRAISDAAFRRQLNSDPTGALRGFDLSADEASALRTGDAGRLSSLGVDQRMSKSYAIGGMASTRLSASDLTPGGGPALVDDLSGAAGRTVTPADPTRPGGAVDIDGGTSGTSSVHVGDDYKFAGRVAPESSGTVRTGDDWMFSDRVSAQSGSVAPVEGSPEATALENKSAGGSMANYPAHDGLAGPSGISSVRAGDDWARSSVDIADAGRIGTARLDDATGGASGGANVIHDDPNGFLAANADATGGSAATPDAFIDQSETYLTRGFDTSQAATPDADTTWSGDDIAGPASVSDAGGAENPHVSTDDGQLTP